MKQIVNCNVVQITYTTSVVLIYNSLYEPARWKEKDFNQRALHEAYAVVTPLRKAASYEHRGTLRKI